MNRQPPPPKRQRASRKAWRPPTDRRELTKTIGAGAAVVVLSAGAVLFLGRDHLGGDDSSPSTPVPTAPSGASTPTPSLTIPDSAPPAPAPEPGGETSPSTTLPGAPTP